MCHNNNSVSEKFHDLEEIKRHALNSLPQGLKGRFQRLGMLLEGGEKAGWGWEDGRAHRPGWALCR